MLRHTKDFIPQLVEFKLSSVINGSGSSKPVFPDSPNIGENYTPRKLKEIIKQINSR